jgi:nucleotide-binding universal stress UspA family protein
MKTEYGSTGETLLAEAYELDAGLLVMGAYTHSRLRRMILGSATEHMLSASNVPLFMTH